MAEININLNTEAFEKAIKELQNTIKGGKGGAGTNLEAEALFNLQKQKLKQQEITKESLLQAKVAVATVGSYNQMNAQLELLNHQAKKFGLEIPKGQEGWKNHIEAAKQLDIQIKLLDADMGKFQRNVGNYSNTTAGLKAKFDGLGFSVQQVARELPSLAYGPRVFFSAISNNLPIVIDQIRIAKTELAALNEKGIKGVPVWKQLAGSLFGWQTAMVLGITALTLYGDKLVKWIGQLLKSKEAIDLTKEAILELRNVQLEGVQGAQGDLIKAKLLYEASQITTKGQKNQHDAAKLLIEQYPQYFKNLTEEQILLGKGKKSYDDLLASIEQLSIAEVSLGKIEENNKKLLELNTFGRVIKTAKDGTKIYEEFKTRAEYLMEAQKTFQEGGTPKKWAEQMQINARVLSEVNKLLFENVELEKKIDIVKVVKPKGGDKGVGDKGKKEVDEQKKLNEQLAKLEKEYLESTFSDQDKEIAAVADMYEEILSNALLTADQRTRVEEMMYQRIVAIGLKYNEMLLAQEAKLAGDEDKIREKKLEDELKRITKRAQAEAKATAEAAKAKAKLQADETKKEERMFNDALQLQNNLADIGFSIFEGQKKKELELAGDNAVRREQIEKEYARKEQTFAIAMAIINTAVAVTKALRTAPPPFNLIEAAIALTAGLAQVASIRAQSFAKGEIDIQGPGTETSDSIPAWISRGETITTADKTKRYRPALEAIHRDRFEEYVYVNYVLPEMTRDGNTDINRGTAVNMYENLKLKAELDDLELRRRISEGNLLSIKNTDRIVNALNKRIVR